MPDLSLDAFAVVIAVAWLAALWFVAHLAYMDKWRARRARRAWRVPRQRRFRP